MDIVLNFLKARGKKTIRPDERDNILKRIRRWKAHLVAQSSSPADWPIVYSKSIMIRFTLVLDIFLRPCWPGSYLHSSKPESKRILIWALALASVPPRCRATRVTSFSPWSRSFRILSRVPDERARPMRSTASSLLISSVSDNCCTFRECCVIPQAGVYYTCCLGIPNFHNRTRTSQ